MRFTRPGARPRHSPPGRLDSTQLRSRVLGPRVEDESPRAELRAGEVLQFVPSSVGWVELDVEVVMASTTTWRLLVHRHDIRKRPLEEAVVLLQQALQDVSEGLVVFLIQVGQPTAMLDGREMNLIRPAGERGDECDPPLVAKHGSLAGLLAFDHVAVEAPPGLAHVPYLSIQLPLDDRRHERVRVDLPMRMTERHADHLASILEDVDVSDVGQPSKLVGAIAAPLDQVAEVIDALLTERRV